MAKLVGRKPEMTILDHRLSTREAELIAVFGRRRVGKTYLIRNYLEPHTVFELTGVHGATTTQQLENFSLALTKAVRSPAPLAAPKSWLQAFFDLDRYLLDTLGTNKPVVVFFDEFPWLHTSRSNFLRSFDHWWNSSGTKRSNLKVVICGSAASWMIEKILRDRGGLHNRVTEVIRVMPFNLAETAELLKSRGVVLNQLQVMELYMAMGGIPYYLQQVVPGESAAQAIDRLSFTPNGLLRNEFKNLFESLFSGSEQHERVVRALAQKAGGLTRDEIIAKTEMRSGGGITKLLKELEESGFISNYIPFGKLRNESIYRLSDEYSIFYQRFIEHSKATGGGTWLKKSQTPGYRSWSGFAFESVCHKHVDQLKRALGISDVLTEVSSWRFQPKPGDESKGAQIDLLLDRQDKTINVCEMKFSEEEFVIDKKYAAELDNKLSVFRRETKTRKVLFLSLITTYGVRKNPHYTGRVLREVTMDQLFE